MTSDAPSPLQAHGLRLNTGDRALLAIDGLHLDPGQMIALVGPNGAGKSSLLRALAGVAAPAAGRVTLGGNAIAGLAPAERARHIAFLAQHPEVPFPFSALEAVLLGRSPHLGLFGLPAAADVAAASAALRALEIERLARTPLTRLSGGERQRVHVARALVQGTSVLLLDEPTSAQDFRGTALVLRELTRRARAGALVVMALHDLNLAPRFFDRVVLLAAGGVLADAPPREVLRPELLRRAWGEGLEVVALPDGSPVVRARRLGDGVSEPGLPGEADLPPAGAHSPQK